MDESCRCLLFLCLHIITAASKWWHDLWSPPANWHTRDLCFNVARESRIKFAIKLWIDGIFFSLFITKSSSTRVKWFPDGNQKKTIEHFENIVKVHSLYSIFRKTAMNAIPFNTEKRCHKQRKMLPKHTKFDGKQRFENNTHQLVIATMCVLEYIVQNFDCWIHTHKKPYINLKHCY